MARVKAQLAQYERLKGKPKDDSIVIGDIILNPSTHIVTVRGQEKLLPKKNSNCWNFS